MSQDVSEVLHRVVVLRGEPVVVAKLAAELFGVQTREVVQAIKRNPEKFGDAHAFQADADEWALLRSHGVISKPGRGGSRVAPWLLTQKGVMRLATILSSPRALQATDLMIEVFLEAHAQLRAGASKIQFANPERVTQDDATPKRFSLLKNQLLDALQELLNATIDSRREKTVADEISETSGALLDHIKAGLRTRDLENEKIKADTVLILEQARTVADRRETEIRQASAETERVILQNVILKIEIVERLLQLTSQMEPNSAVAALPMFTAPLIIEDDSGRSPGDVSDDPDGKFE